MRKFEYSCDICKSNITPMKRIINVNGVPITSKHDSIQRIVLKQIDIDSNNFILSNEQDSKDYDLCGECWDAIISVLRERKKS